MALRIADFEVNVRPTGRVGRYTVETRLLLPEAAADNRYVASDVVLDLDALEASRHDVVEHGRQLGRALLADPKLGEQLTIARTAAAVAGGANGNGAVADEVVLHVRLFIEPGAGELHRQRWEALRHPDDDTLLFAGDHVLFSRYLTSRDLRRVRLRPRTGLRALVAVAAPTNVESYQPGGHPLADVDAPAEVARARASLQGIATDVLIDDGRCTLERLVGRLRTGYDILYLVCHGALRDREPLVMLEQDDGTAQMIRGIELVAAIGELRLRPTLVVLASCQSGAVPDDGGDPRAADQGALSALGPRLAEAGIPAVVAMQDDVTLETMQRFVPALFTELGADGQVVRAMAAARATVGRRDDWWMPALYTRLRGGMVWYEPGLRATDQADFQRWPALLTSIRDHACTPILGPGLLEPMIGARQELARQLADRFFFPLAPQDREDLPRVCQYLAVHLNPGTVPRELVEQRCAALRANAPAGTALPAQPGKNAPPEVLADYYLALLQQVRRATPPAAGVDPHELLASLPCRTYLTTNDDDLLERALCEAGRSPRVDLCPWNDRIEPLAQAEPYACPGVAATAAGAAAADAPLVYHLFGRTALPDSLVLTEDDHFDFLVGVTSNRDLIPRPVRRALADTSLLFLGFQIDDWNFRVLFRSIMGQEGSSRRARYSHVAVQLDPEGGHAQEPDRARRYLSQFFGSANISIFWGSVEDFASKLRADL